MTVIQSFMNRIKNYDTENFIKCILFCFGAPTIKGIKAACLINLRRGNDNIQSLWKKYADEWLNPFKVEWILLNEFSLSKNALVLIYRRELLMKALDCDEACEILQERGYPLPDIDACLKCLCERFCHELPHEVGIFLDYPPEDVKGFIENRNAKNLSCQGYWKVYGNVERAKKTFERYKRAECDAARLMLLGG